MTAVTEIVETTDLALAESILAAAYGTLRFDNPGGGGGMWLRHTTLTPSVRLDRDRFGMTAQLSGDELGLLVIGELRAGRLDYESDGSERRLRRGDVFLAAQPESRWEVLLADSDAAVAAIAPAMLSQVAATAPSRKARPVRLTGYTATSTRAAAIWKRTYAFAQQLVELDAGAEPLVAGAAARALAAASLAAFPNTALVEPTSTDRRDAHPASLRRAVALIESYPDLDLTPRDIASAARVSQRAVQLAFRRHLGTTPTAYLRRVRLDRAHAELQAAVPGDGTTVTQVSARWGYARPSRFAADYRAAYGRYPRDVLRNRHDT